MNNTKSNQLRSRLPRLAAELDQSIEYALATIRAAQKAERREGQLNQAWKKGLEDALAILRPAHEAHSQFRQWLAEVVAQEVDACGLTREERESVFGPAMDVT